MADKREPRDSRLNVARYQVHKLDPEAAAAAAAENIEPNTNEAGQSMMDARAQFVEISIQQAMRRGDFDNLPGTGKPLTGLTDTYDPDWWIRGKIEREQITGLGPPALTLRTENAALDGRLDAATSERAVREILDDFNKRVIEARRQLRGGPPVVTPVRDVDEELDRWRARRDTARRERAEAQEREQQALAAMSWRERRRAKREQR